MSKFGDTPRFDGKSLCETCRSAQITSGVQYRDKRVTCHRSHTALQLIPQPVLNCTDYDDKRIPPVWEMEKIAWRISPDLRRKTVGFFSPIEWKQRVRSGQEVDDHD